MPTNNIDPLFTNNSYVNFDATSINELIISRLNENKIFTDQNFQGSNLSSLLDVISYTFSTLLYYLNKTSSETMFSETQIYENMNRIVKLLNYNPKGYLTQSVGYTINASLLPNNYMIPRYSYLKVGSITFSFVKDIYFTFLEDRTIEIQNPENDQFLFQGKIQEYPLYTALGAINEVLFINLGNSVTLDHNNIHVYVQYANTDKWAQWQQTPNLFLNKSNDEVFEIRYNANKNYEIKFGDNINGKQLNTNDTVLVYYLAIDVNSSTIASNTLKKSKIIPYNSLNYLKIQKDTVKFPAVILDSTYLSNVTINNDYPSNSYVPEESVEQIRKNAPKSFSYQQRLVTANDFQNYIADNFLNILSDCYVVNNEDYLKGHMKYLYNIGIKSPQLDNSILYNQIKFSNSCNFNNIYAYIVPNNNSQKYATAAQKELILNNINPQQILTCDVIPMDPVYMSFDFYVKNPTTKANIDDLNYNSLLIYKTKNSRQSNSGIINSVIEIIKNAFDKKNVKLGQFIDINQISSDIVNLESVDYIKTYRSDIDTYIDGLSLLVWNTVYPTLDCDVYSYNFELQYFQYPMFNDIDNLINRIKVIETTGSISITDY
jgi:uncharacterized membrane protein (UPF0127 family)